MTTTYEQFLDAFPETDRCYHTGGGCTAWLIELDKPGGERYVLVTAHDDSSRPVSTDTGVDVGLYDTESEGECLAFAGNVPWSEAADFVWRQMPRSPRTLARVFTTKVREALSPEQLAAVVVRNIEERWGGVCHSHDFMDANECMLEALESSGYEYDPADEAQVNATNIAWDLAKAARFEPAAVIDPQAYAVPTTPATIADDRLADITDGHAAATEWEARLIASELLARRAGDRQRGDK